MRALHERLLDLPQVGALTWIGVRPAHGAPMVALDDAEVLADRGIVGDVVMGARTSGKRQVTLVQHEHLPVIASLAHAAEVAPTMLRRNLVVRGVNLVALGAMRFAVGDEVVLVGTGACAPCGQMDRTIGPGAFQAMRGHGGITARVERGGRLRVGDAVRALGAAPTKA
jgi:MOSC domain-containing protein YiiM